MCPLISLGNFELYMQFCVFQFFSDVLQYEYEMNQSIYRMGENLHQTRQDRDPVSPAALFKTTQVSQGPTRHDFVSFVSCNLVTYIWIFLHFAGADKEFQPMEGEGSQHCRERQKNSSTEAELQSVDQVKGAQSSLLHPDQRGRFPWKPSICIMLNAGIHSRGTYFGLVSAFICFMPLTHVIAHLMIIALCAIEEHPASFWNVSLVVTPDIIWPGFLPCHPISPWLNYEWKQLN